MTGNGGAKRLPCNHIFHVSCLRSWFQRQQTCPTCRMDVLRIAPNVNTDNVRAQQPQQPRAQPGIPGIPGMPAQFFIPPNWQPFAVPQPPPQQQQPNQSNNNNNNNNNVNNNNNNINNNNINPNQMGGNVGPQVSRGPTAGPLPVPPFITFPPFAMPYMTAPPMPTPPPDLSRLSVEELRALEGNERQHIEARIKCLRNVQTLVEAAVLQLQQYHQISNRWTPSQTAPNPDTASTSSQPNASEDTTSSMPSTSSADTLHDSPSSPAEIIRQRRLQRFSQTQPPVIDSNTDSVVTEACAQGSSQTLTQSDKENDSKELNKTKVS